MGDGDLGGEFQLDGASISFTTKPNTLISTSEDNMDMQKESQVSEFNMSQIERNAMNFFS
jgi:hypothetical protein